MTRFMKTILAALILTFSITTLNGWAAQQKTVPLPDDDPSRAAAAPETVPHELPAPAVLSHDVSGAAPDSWAQTEKLSGIKVDFRVVPSLKDVIVKHGPMSVSLNELTSSEMVEGQQGVLQFRFTDPAGTPLSGLRVAAWLDRIQAGKPADDKTCHNKIQSFLQMQFSARPEVDLNTYYILALTKEPAMLIIDPRIGFGSSKLYGMVDLAAPGMDWALTGNNERLFITMPEVHKVAAIDTMTFRVITNVDAGEKPMRAVLQPDGKYLWIGNDARENAAESDVTVIDAATLKVAAHIPTGKGHHEIAFDERQNAYVTNQDDGTVSVINMQKLSKVSDLPVGEQPIVVIYSSRSRMIYVASHSDGKVMAISAEGQKAVATLLAKPGVNALQLSPDGRWGFVANGPAKSVAVFDTSSNQFKESYKVEHSPDQLSATAAYIYVRSHENEEIAMIPLAGAGRGGSTASFPAGQAAPGAVTELASAIAPGLENSSVFVANPADRRIYYYEEGMAAPMNSMEGYGKTPKAAMVLDRSIHETTTGVYSVGLRLPKAGEYDVPLFVDSPSLSHCFEFSVKVNPLLKKEVDVPVYLQALKNNLQVHPGEAAQVSFRLVDSATGKPKTGLEDVEITVLLAEGMRQLRFTAEHAGEGVYQFTFTPPKHGAYYVMVQIPSLKVKHNQLPYLTVRATEQAASDAKPPKGNE